MKSVLERSDYPSAHWLHGQHNSTLQWHHTNASCDHQRVFYICVNSCFCFTALGQSIFFINYWSVEENIIIMPLLTFASTWHKLYERHNVYLPMKIRLSSLLYQRRNIREWNCSFSEQIHEIIKKKVTHFPPSCVSYIAANLWID